MNENRASDVVEIDLLDLIKLLWSKIWIIIISMVLCATIAFSASIFMISPKYTATAMMYVNNSSLSVGSSTITFSSSQLSAAKSLLDVYVIILESRTTLEAAIERADLKYSYGQLKSIVSSSSVNDTEIFNISATCTNPADAELIVDTLVEILPERISDIVDGSSVRVVDHAILPTGSSSPSYTRYAFMGAIVGAVVSVAAIIIRDLMDTTVRDEEYLRNRYNIPVLAVVPDVHGGTKKGYGYGKYGYKYGRYKYGYHRRDYYRQGYQRRYEESYEKAQSNQDGDKR